MPDLSHTTPNIEGHISWNNKHVLMWRCRVVTRCSVGAATLVNFTLYYHRCTQESTCVSTQPHVSNTKLLPTWTQAPVQIVHCLQHW